MKSLSLVDLLLACYLLVHLHFEYRLWIRRDQDVFVRYGKEGRSPLRTAALAYWAKALWLLVLVLLQTVGVPFREAFAMSFLIYSVAAQLIMPVNAISVVQLILGLACLAQLKASGQ